MIEINILKKNPKITRKFKKINEKNSKIWRKLSLKSTFNPKFEKLKFLEMYILVIEYAAWGCCPLMWMVCRRETVSNQRSRSSWRKSRNKCIVWSAASRLLISYIMMIYWESLWVYKTLICAASSLISPPQYILHYIPSNFIKIFTEK